MAEVWELVGLLLLGAGAWLIASNYNHWRIARLVSKTPTRNVAAVDDEGLVAVRGEAVPAAGTMKAPLSGTDDTLVAGWRVNEWSPSRKQSNGGTWNPIAMGIDSEPFDVTNGERRIRVEAGTQSTGGRLKVIGEAIGGTTDEGVSVGGVVCEFKTLSPDQRVDVGTEPPDNVKAFVEREPAVSTQRQWGGSEVTVKGDRQYCEERIEVGDEVYVLGHAVMNDHAANPPQPDDLTIRPAGRKPLVISPIEESYIVSRAGKSGRSIAVGAALILTGAILLGVGLL